jgi:hypothetical protein
MWMLLHKLFLDVLRWKWVFNDATKWNTEALIGSEFLILEVRTSGTTSFDTVELLLKILNLLRVV